jgi:molybdopterin/thiamine biosynthesis adenylyltransferase/nitroreductase
MMIREKARLVTADLTWRPWVLDPNRDQDRQKFDDLLDRGDVWRIYDTIEQQIEDLTRTRHPQWIKEPVDDARVQVEMEALTGSVPLKDYGRWVYYPWSGSLVHLLPPEEFQELRLNRNRNKITLTEQQKLAQTTIGIVGLSVGNAVATALAIEGLSGCLKLADFDRLDLSNMNRIRASVGDVGLPKTVLCARQIYEMNPYAQIVLFQEGLTEDNLEDFFGGDPALDIVIDECDDIRLKFLLRERAREQGLPVLMETNDRGMLDVERFDLEPNRPLFHGLLDGISSAAIPTRLSNEEKVQFVAPIIGLETLSTRIAASMLEIGETITTWPQLGSEVLLGGAIVSAAVRKLILDRTLVSGRRYIDLAQLLSKERCKKETLSHRDGDNDDPVASTAFISPEPVPQTEPISDLMRYLVSQAILAPSGGNSQPWRFYTDNETLWVVHDRFRSQNLLDPDHRGAYVGLGAAIENIRIAAAHRGYATDITYFPHGDPTTTAGDETVAALHFRASRTVQHTPEAELWPYIQQRITDRKTYGRSPLLRVQREQLMTVAAHHNCHLALLEEDDALAEIGEIVGEGDRLRFLQKETHRELMTEVRWTEQEAVATGDGLDLATLELTATQTTGFKLLRRPEVAQFVRRQRGGSALTELSEKAIKRSSAIGLICVTGRYPKAQVQGGQAVETLWLVANSLGLAWHPMTSLIYMFNSQATLQYTPQEWAIFCELRERFNRLFPEHGNYSQLMLFRLSRGKADGPRSLRRPPEEVLFFGRPDYENRKEHS